MILNIGDNAPDFTLPTDTNDLLTLSHLRGQWVLLYFYPKDNTPGCTQEACDFRDHFAQLTSRHVVVLGVSKDSREAHAKFKQKYQLPFPLLVDADLKVCKQYGVVNPKSLFGKSFLGITRSSFLIDEHGLIRAIWRKVKVNGHVAQVLASFSG